MIESYINSIRYVTDIKGRHQEVIIPIKLWKDIVEEIENLKEKQNFLMGIKTACQEVKIKRTEKGSKQTLEEFLNEL